LARAGALGELCVGRLFTVLFWGYFVATYASYFFGDWGDGVVPVTLASVALTLACSGLQWELRVSHYQASITMLPDISP
jgi:hypothetical protein